MMVVLASGTHDGHAATGHQHDPGAALSAQTGKQLALHDGMRGRWEQHVAWTRLAIVSFAGSNADLPKTEERLLRNQVDIGNAIKPFYGRAAGDELTHVLKLHLSGAAALLVAAKAGDAGALANAKTAWYANGNQIADLLSAANRHNWQRAAVPRTDHSEVTRSLSRPGPGLRAALRAQAPGERDDVLQEDADPGP